MDSSGNSDGRGAPDRNFSCPPRRLRLTGQVSSASLALLLLALLVSRAAASPGSRLTIDGDLPCTHDELAEALSLRVGDATVAVAADGDQVRISIAGSSRLVPLDGTRGRAAARRIAVAAAELALPSLPSDPLPLPLPLPEAPCTTVPCTVVRESPRGAMHRSTRWTITGRVGSEEALRGGAMIGMVRGKIAIDVGVVAGGAGDVILVGAPVRAGVVFGDELAIKVGGIAIPFRVDAGAGDRGVLIGGGLEAVNQTRVGGVDVTYLFGLDVYANRVEYRMEGAPVVTTPRVALWTGVGVTWEGW
jgi:hypothetical protein